MIFLKGYLIKIRSIIFSIYWILFKFVFFKIKMRKLGVNKLKITKYDLWTNKVLFFTGVSKGKRVFTKLYLDKNKNQRESKFLQLLDGFNTSLSYPRLLNDSVCEFGYVVTQEEINYVTLVNIMDKFTISCFKRLTTQLLKMLDDFSSMGIVHCDITPSNLLVSQDDLFVIDFEYSVCKKNKLFMNLNFESQVRLKSLGGDYRYDKDVLTWDDAYSCLNIAKEIIYLSGLDDKESVLVENEIIKLESRVGLNQYKY